MKIILAIALAFGISTAHAEAIMKKVCHEDTKTKKEICKTIKTHRQVEGTPVPEKAPVKPKSTKK